MLAPATSPATASAPSPTATASAPSPAPVRIALVEDNKDVRAQLAHMLSSYGYDVVEVLDFAQVADTICALDPAPHLVLLDLSLPVVDGQFVCKELRRRAPLLPLMVVTARNSELEEVMALSAGADDFVPKPYSAPVLLARIERLLARSSKTQLAQIIKACGLELNMASARVVFAGKQAELTKNELRLLHVLMRHAHQVVSRSELMSELWATDEFVDDNTLTVNMSHLRQTLAALGATDVIATRRGLGYELVDSAAREGTGSC